MARCLILGVPDGAGNTPVIDGGVYAGGTSCLTVALDPSEYQAWTSTSALLSGFTYTDAGTLLTAALACWSLAWVLSIVRR